MAEEGYPDGPQPLGAAEAALLDARVKHKVALWCKSAEEDAGLAFRWMLWQMFRDGTWANVREYQVDEHGNPAVDGDTGERLFRSFAEYREWFDYVTDGKSDPVRSALWNGVTRFLNAIDQGRVTKPDGVAWTVEEVFPMSDRNFAVLAGAAYRMDRDDRVEDLAGFIGPGLTLDQDDLMAALQEAGEATRRIPIAHAFRAMREDGTQLVMMELNEAQARSVMAATKHKVEWHAATTATLAAFFTGDPINHEQPTTPDLTAYLAGRAWAEADDSDTIPT